MFLIFFQSISRFYKSNKNTLQTIFLFMLIGGKNLNVAFHVSQLKNEIRVGVTFDNFKDCQFLISALFR